MSNETILSIIDKLVKRGAQPMNLSWPEGWDQIIEELDEAISEIDPKYTVSQVKEKFGGLRYYYRMSENSTGDDYAAVKKIVYYAEGLAYKTCMTCGEPGTYLQNEQVLCPTHREEYEDADNGPKTYLRVVR